MQAWGHNVEIQTVFAGLAYRFYLRSSPLDCPVRKIGLRTGTLSLSALQTASSAPGLEEFIQRSSATGGMPDRAGATKDEVYRAIEALTLGERLKLKHFVAWGVRGLGRASCGADSGGSAERSEPFDFGRCIAASIG